MEFHEALKFLGKSIVPRLLKSPDYKPARVVPPSSAWRLRAAKFVKYAQDKILDNADIMEWLRCRGIPKDAVIKYKLGWNPKLLKDKQKNWGLDSGSETIYLSAGLVIPTVWPNNDIIRLKIRRKDWTEDSEYSKYMAVIGSANGLNVFGDTKKEILAETESELDAIALVHAAGDHVFCIAAGGNNKNPDNLSYNLAKGVKHLLICHDNDESGLVMLNKWKVHFSHAKPFPTPVGKDIGHAVELGFDIRSWILGVLPKQNNVVVETVAPTQEVAVDSSLEVVVNTVEDALEAEAAEVVEVSVSPEQPTETMDPTTGEIIESVPETNTSPKLQLMNACHCNPFKFVEGKCECDLKNAPTFICNVCSPKYCNCFRCKEIHAEERARFSTKGIS
jgi:hypothetical protein